jgi:hypothetical protein
LCAPSKLRYLLLAFRLDWRFQSLLERLMANREPAKLGGQRVRASISAIQLWGIYHASPADHRLDASTNDSGEDMNRDD